MKGQYKILLIDDDETIRETLTLLLQTEGYLVDEAATGQEALKKAKENFYNLSIVDWRLPDIEGTKLISELKATSPNMIKIMLTGFPSIQNAIESVNNRADAFFIKPVDVSLLLDKIKELLILQEGSKAFNEQKMVEFIENRAKEIMQTKKMDLTPEK